MEFKWDLLRWWRKRFVRKKLPVPRANLSRPTLQLAHGQHKAWPTELQANQLSLLPDAFSKKDARADQATRFSSTDKCHRWRCGAGRSAP